MKEHRERWALLLRTTLVVLIVSLAASGGTVSGSSWDWQERSFSNIQEFTTFLNSDADVHDFKIVSMKGAATGPIDIEIIFRSWGIPSLPWAYQKYTNAADVVKFLNGVAGTKVTRGPPSVIKDFNIYALWNSVLRRVEFYLFYQPDVPRARVDHNQGMWKWTASSTTGEMLSVLNASQIGKVRIASVEGALLGNKTVFSFYELRSPNQTRGGWRMEIVDSLAELRDSFNRVVAVDDNKNVGSMKIEGATHYWVIRPEGFLIYTRPMFLSSPIVAEYCKWKYDNGFDVYYDVADHLPRDEDIDLRFQIRELFREYYYSAGVRYVVMIGDSIDEPQPPDDPSGGIWKFPAASLSEPWNLPAGYYMVANKTTLNTVPVVTTRFYADLSDKDSYSLDEYSYMGDYRIYVGVIPVRTIDELKNVLQKTMAAKPTDAMTWFYAEAPYSQAFFNDIARMAGDRVDLQMIIFTTSNTEEYVMDTFFQRTGILQAWTHGFLQGIQISPYFSIYNEDAVLFSQINPLFIDGSCWTMGYYYGESLDEAYLKAPEGPAAISLPPVSWWGDLPVPDYYMDLFAGKSIGSAFYDNAANTFINPDVLFGDPSLVVVR